MSRPLGRALVLLAIFLVGAAAARAEAHRMFVTSATGTGNLSSWSQAGGQTGVAAGDAICRSLAAAQGLPNAATYVAWLSTSTDDAYCRVAGYAGKKSAKCGRSTLPDAGPWQRTDGKPFVASLSVLTGSPAILHPPAIDETGATVSGMAHTGTNSLGALYVDNTCANWTVETEPPMAVDGMTYTTVSYWTAGNLKPCSGLSHLYCFEPGIGEALPPWEESGALVFVTSAGGGGDLSSWPLAGGAVGIAAGDAICQAEAEAADLLWPESFVAWLSVPDQVDAIDRLTIDGPWKRLDGIQVAATKSALLGDSSDQVELETPIGVTAAGTYVDTVQVFTGTASGDGRATSFDCDGWSSGSDPSEVTYGYAFNASGSWTTTRSDTVCDLPSGRLYCFSNVVLQILVFEDDFEAADLAAWSARSP